MVLLPSMDIYHNINVPVSGSLPPISTPQDFSYSMEGDEQDVSLEWLSIFVEDCLSSTTTSFMALPSTIPSNSIPSQTPKDINSPSKPRTKRRKTTTPNPNPNPKPKPKPKASCDFSHNSILYDPPLLHQTQWLADSELIFPKKDPLIVDKVEIQDDKDEVDEDDDEEEEEQQQHQEEQEQQHEKQQQQQQQQQQQARRCSHCLSQRTPQWRAGPLGPKTLCNACGVRFKSGRLLPEYRPAKSPTFVSYKHSNSHKKVMEMRMSIMSTNSISN
ncbi:GATA transcription factor 12-like [Dioscorea cayenensis subsp. rotundata]|uniref:GATA transcription factor 12-like n=1 Tax=Dioscorea cayennensis subsp. rotundata TaxID=55577 RepID=A0AB40AVU8_DIOCR|nr:GATA transcription factor 12-like [Dioscorea cayenensis subsp. rotundata]